MDFFRRVGSFFSGGRGGGAGGGDDDDMMPHGGGFPGHPGGFGAFPDEMPGRPHDTYAGRFHVVDWMIAGRPENNYTGRVSLPPSALRDISNRNVPYPLMFKISNPNNSYYTHTGGPEFDAEEGTIVLPYWMMLKLRLQYHDVVEIQTTVLPRGVYVKFQGHSSEYAQLADIRAVLEMKMKDFFTLTRGDDIIIEHLGIEMPFTTLEVRAEEIGDDGFPHDMPTDAICLLDTDIKVEFERPVDMQPEAMTETAGADADPLKALHAADDNAVVVTRSGFRIYDPIDALLLPSAQAAAPDNVGVRIRDPTQLNVPEGFEAFKGEGRTLRRKK